MSPASPATPSPATPMECQRWWRHRTNPDWPLATMARRCGYGSGHRHRRSYLDRPEGRHLGVGGGTGRLLGCLCRRRHIRRRRGSADLGSSHRVTLHTLTAIPARSGRWWWPRTGRGWLPPTVERYGVGPRHRRTTHVTAHRGRLVPPRLGIYDNRRCRRTRSLLPGTLLRLPSEISAMISHGVRPSE